MGGGGASYADIFIGNRKRGAIMPGMGRHNVITQVVLATNIL